MDKLAMSFSRLNTFEQCQAKFDYLYVSKTVKDQFNDASAYGDRVHKTLQAYGEGKLSADKLNLEQKQTLERWGPMVDFLLNRTQGRAMFEQQLCVDYDLNPVDWFSKSAYIRAIIDLLIIDGDTAYCFDYKTGKRKDDDTQLKLFAAMIFFHYPQVKVVKSAYIWLKDNKTDAVVFTRHKLVPIWSSFEARLDEVYSVIELGYFEAKPSGLCNYCPAQKVCPSAR